MKNSWRNAFLLLLTLLATIGHAVAQTTDTPEMADALRQSGKIYVVVAVILIVVIGLIGYLISLDRKVSRLEKEIR